MVYFTDLKMNISVLVASCEYCTKHDYTTQNARGLKCTLQCYIHLPAGIRNYYTCQYQSLLCRGGLVVTGFQLARQVEPNDYETVRFY